MNEAKFYKQLEKNIVQCQLCNHFCTIKNNKTGICGVRKNNNGILTSLAYGHPVAMNIDPVEKKPLFHFLPGSQTYSLGTLGCNFHCDNCHNFDMSQAKNIEKMIADNDMLSPEKVVEEALGNGCKSISYTYNEPTVWTEYALEIMKLAHLNDLKNIWVSNGFMSVDCAKTILPYLDAINIDIKSMDNDFYKENCNARLAPILENAKFFKNEQVHVEITTLIIPTLSDDLSMLEKLSTFMSKELDTETPWHISKFAGNISWKLKKLRDTPEDIVHNTYEVGKEAGLKYVYTGNMPGDHKENTYCPSCKELAITRMGYNIERHDNSGYCPNCDKNLEIIDE